MSKTRPYKTPTRGEQRQRTRQAAAQQAMQAMKVASSSVNSSKNFSATEALFLLLLLNQQLIGVARAVQTKQADSPQSVTSLTNTLHRPKDPAAQVALVREYSPQFFMPLSRTATSDRSKPTASSPTPPPLLEKQVFDQLKQGLRTHDWSAVESLLKQTTLTGFKQYFGKVILGETLTLLGYDVINHRVSVSTEDEKACLAVLTRYVSCLVASDEIARATHLNLLSLPLMARHLSTDFMRRYTDLLHQQAIPLPIPFARAYKSDQLYDAMMGEIFRRGDPERLNQLLRLGLSRESLEQQIRAVAEDANQAEPQHPEFAHMLVRLGILPTTVLGSRQRLENVYIGELTDTNESLLHLALRFGLKDLSKTLIRYRFPLHESGYGKFIEHPVITGRSEVAYTINYNQLDILEFMLKYGDSDQAHGVLIREIQAHSELYLDMLARDDGGGELMWQITEILFDYPPSSNQLQEELQRLTRRLLCRLSIGEPSLPHVLQRFVTLAYEKYWVIPSLDFLANPSGDNAKEQYSLVELTVISGNPELLKIIMLAGASPDYYNTLHLSPVEIAKMQGAEECVTLLQKMRAFNTFFAHMQLAYVPVSAIVLSAILYVARVLFYPRQEERNPLRDEAVRFYQRRVSPQTSSEQTPPPKPEKKTNVQLTPDINELKHLFDTTATNIQRLLSTVHQLVSLTTTASTKCSEHLAMARIRIGQELKFLAPFHITEEEFENSTGFYRAIRLIEESPDSLSPAKQQKFYHASQALLKIADELSNENRHSAQDNVLNYVRLLSKQKQLLSRVNTFIAQIQHELDIQSERVASAEKLSNSGEHYRRKALRRKNYHGGNAKGSSTDYDTKSKPSSQKKEQVKARREQRADRRKVTSLPNVPATQEDDTFDSRFLAELDALMAQLTATETVVAAEPVTTGGVWYHKDGKVPAVENTPMFIDQAMLHQVVEVARASDHLKSISDLFSLRNSTQAGREQACLSMSIHLKLIQFYNLLSLTNLQCRKIRVWLIHHHREVSDEALNKLVGLTLGYCYSGSYQLETCKMQQWLDNPAGFMSGLVSQLDSFVQTQIENRAPPAIPSQSTYQAEIANYYQLLGDLSTTSETSLTHSLAKYMIARNLGQMHLALEQVSHTLPDELIGLLYQARVQIRQVIGHKFKPSGDSRRFEFADLPSEQICTQLLKRFVDVVSQHPTLCPRATPVAEDDPAVSMDSPRLGYRR